jgi:hypothetical protein
LFLSLHIDFYFFSKAFCLGSCHTNLNRNYLTWLNVKCLWINCETLLWTSFILECNVASNTTLVFELNLLILCLAIGYEAHIYKWFKLNIWSWLVSVQMKLIRSIVAFTTNFNHIVIISLVVTFKLDIQFNRKSSSDVSNVFVVTTEVWSLGLCELESL